MLGNGARALALRGAPVKGRSLVAASARPAVAGFAQNFSAGGEKFGGSRLERMDSFIGVSSRRKGKRSAEEAVNNILYNAPISAGKEERHIMSCLVDNEPGVLSKVSGLLSARGFNIDSLTVGATDVKDLSRMTIVLKGANSQLEQAARQLEDLCDVWAVVDYRGVRTIERELAIVKVNCHPPPDAEGNASRVNGNDALTYDEMMASHFHRQAILELAQTFGASVNDVGSEHMILEIVSWSSRVDAFLNMLQPFGIEEAARTGVIAMNRSTVNGYDGDDDEVAEKVDLKDLPPS